jgi:NAD-dependent dihydropyrimidine dehydrogenase PreA subunit
MASMFIRLEIDPEASADRELAKKLVEVCPVNIFDLDGEGKARVVEENEDECVLCDLCVQAAPAGQVRVVKLYEQPG